jgi:mannitol-1-phosphate 5-dehydrogenase
LVKKAVMYGAGNIGRGFIAQLFNRSGYEVVFIDIDKTLIDGLNREGSYPIRIVSNDGEEEVQVEGVRGVDGREPGLVAEEIATADIMATAVGVNILPRIAPILAEGLKRRWAMQNSTPLNIIVCENLLNAQHYLADLIAAELNDEDKTRLKEQVGFVEASIGRMVPVLPPEVRAQNPLLVCVEPYDHLPVDREGFKGEIPAIYNMEPHAPFDFYIQRKLYLHNMAHAAAAYIGRLTGSQFIWEAVEDPVIKVFLLRIFTESALALSLEHGVPMSVLIDHTDNLLYRFGNRRLGDTIDRVGREPVRKLAADDRLAGAASLSMKHGRLPVYISLAIAAGYSYNAEGDTGAAEIQAVIKLEGIASAVRKFSGFEDGPVLDLVTDFYNKIQSGVPLKVLLREAESIKNRVFKSV